MQGKVSQKGQNLDKGISVVPGSQWVAHSQLSQSALEGQAHCRKKTINVLVIGTWLNKHY